MEAQSTGVSTRPSLVWFRLDLRLADNPALCVALERRSPVIPVYVWAPEEEGSWPPGAASRWWLNNSLARLQEALEKRGSRLVIRRGPATAALRSLAVQANAGAVFWNRRYEPAEVSRDQELKTMLRGDGLLAESFNGSLLFEPGTVLNKGGQPFQVFSAFWRSLLAKPEPAPPAGAPRRLPRPRDWPESLALSDLGLEPASDWAGGLRATWQPGEAGAMQELRRFLDKPLEAYPGDRDRPDRRGTSRLSPHLHFGEISPRQIWHAVLDRMAQDGSSTTVRAGEAYLRQLGWREFAHHLLFHYPGSPQQPLRGQFSTFPWQSDPRGHKAWQRGKTGYPVVDAGMRELWHTGWMHNRVRMVVASFLVKHLLIDWREGAAWFWDTLVDADLADNTLGWQWTAGCGADAAPYFRIFNPVMQGQKFDPEGDYVRRWVPELARLPSGWIHQPWKAPASVLAEAGVELGKSYPFPIVDHDQARDRALAVLASIRAGGRE